MAADSERLEIDDLEPLQCTVREPVPRPAGRVHRIDHLGGDADGRAASAQTFRQDLEREALKHRRTLERAQQRHRHAMLQQQRRAETWVLLAVLALLIGSGVSWLLGWGVHDAAQIVFTTTFGGLAGYIGGQQRAQHRGCDPKAMS